SRTGTKHICPIIMCHQDLAIYFIEPPDLSRTSIHYMELTSRKTQVFLAQVEVHFICPVRTGHKKTPVLTPGPVARQLIIYIGMDILNRRIISDETDSVIHSCPEISIPVEQGT